MNSDSMRNHTALSVSLVVMVLAMHASFGTANAQSGATYTPHTLAPSLRDQAGAATQKGDLATARAQYERWLEADPRDYSSWYNLACVYSLTGETALALDAFERSVDAGWRDAVHPTRDTDLDAIRFDPRFSAALGRIGRRAAAREPKGYVRHHAEMRSRGTYIVMLPPDYGTSTRQYPICVILHGSGSSELAHGRLADTMGREGVIYVAPRAPYVHPDVVASASMGWDSRPPERIDTSNPGYAAAPIDYVDWILTCVDDVQRRYRAQPGKVFVYGHSQGGAYANMVALTHPERVAAYYSQAASYPGPRFVNLENARAMKAQGVRVWLIHGTEDPVVPPNNTIMIDSVLTLAGVEHRLRMVPGDHGFGGAIMPDILAWVDAVVRGKETSVATEPK